MILNFLVRNILVAAVIILAYFALLSNQATYAQSVSTSGSSAQAQNGVAPKLNDVESELSSLSGTLDNISQALTRDGLRAQELDGFFAESSRIISVANADIAKLQPRLDELKQQLAELGEAPAEGAPPEAAEVQEKRKVLNEQFGRVDADVKAAKLAVVRSQQIQQTITQERQTRFFSSISVQNNDYLTTKFWGKFFGSFKVYFRSLDLLFDDSISVMIGEFKKKPWKIGSLIFFLALFVLVFIRLKKFLSPRVVDETSGFETDFFNSRFVRFVRQALLPVVLIYAIYELFDVLFLLTQRFEDFLAGVLLPISFYIVALFLLKLILSPSSQGERAAGVNDLAANKISRIITTGLSVALVISILNTTSRILVSPVEVTIGLSFVFALVVAIMSLLVLWIFRKDKNKRSQLIETGKPPMLFTYLNILVWLIAIGIVIVTLLGYIALGEFMAQQMLFGLVVIGVAWLLLRAIDNLFAIAAPALHVQGVQLPDAQDDTTANQFAILGSGILKLLIYVSSGILLMLPWGYRTTDIFQIFRDVFFGFEVGGLSISISTILLATGLFFLGYTITVGLKNWLNNKLLPTTKLDIGISNSISTVFGYIGFILAAVLGISAAGFDLSNLAIVAGALSVGVGFGLQSIVNNFVSGLILLAERPIKAGDWIVTAGGEGTVKKISVRSTEIETFDRATVIVPNSTLITDNVTNWTHENKTGRIIIPVGVGYDSDPDQVKEILLECAKVHKLVLGRPAPNVFFMDFGASSLDFQLRCFLADINNSLTVSSELRHAILKALREANIEIPFPQNDVHIKSDNTK